MNKTILCARYTQMTHLKAVVVLGGIVAACAPRHVPPDIGYDTAEFAPAALSVEPPVPPSPGFLPVPQPLPGQLKPLPHAGSGKKDDIGRPESRVITANEAARVEPVEEGYINAVQVYPYMEGALYQLYTAPEQVSDITLEQGENIVAVSAGDTVRWIIGDMVSGVGDLARAHVLVKPIRQGLATNLVIITDRRTYYLELVSTDGTYMASVSWYYPHGDLIALRRTTHTGTGRAHPTIDKGLDIDRLQFRYRISGDAPPWRPVHVFDDGDKVYIRFPDRFDQGEAPPLFVVGTDGENQLVNYRVRGRYYIIDRLFAAAELRLGTDPQQVVRLTRTDVRPNGAETSPKKVSSRRRYAR